MGQNMRFGTVHISEQQKLKGICTDSPECLLLTYTKYSCRARLRLKIVYTSNPT